MARRTPVVADHALRGRHRAVGGPRLRLDDALLGLEPYRRAMDADAYELALHTEDPARTYMLSMTAVEYAAVPRRYVMGFDGSKSDDFAALMASFAGPFEQTLRMALHTGQPGDLKVDWREPVLPTPPFATQGQRFVSTYAGVEPEDGWPLFEPGYGAELAEEDSAWWHDLWEDTMADDTPGKRSADERTPNGRPEA